MISRSIPFIFCLSLLLGAAAHAEEAAKPDDTVSFDISGEDWVATKTAHVAVDVEGAVTAATAGTMRADMVKAVNDAAKSDWRLVNFSRSQDQTGMERWSVSFDTRLPENALGGLADALKKASKPGMQITLSTVDFSPALDEIQSAEAALRQRLIKEAGDQLTALNGTLPGRGYRIAQITFSPEFAPVVPVAHRGVMMSAMASAPDEPAAELERSQKITLNAHIVFAALPTAGAAH